ncbi:MAG: esterase/lipase family protein [Opitutales bacterium]
MNLVQPEMRTPANPDIPCKGDALLLHGIFNKGDVFRPMTQALSTAGWNVYTPSMSPPYGTFSMDELAAQISAYMEQNNIGQSSDRPWILAGFSMGGIVCRALLQNHGVPHWPKTFVTFGSPHHGSLLTYFYPGKGSRDMRPTSRFLKQLKASEDRLPDSLPIYSLWTPLDLMIIPSTNSIWKKAQCEIHWAPLHPWLLISKTVIRRIVEIAG